MSFCFPAYSKSPCDTIFFSTTVQFLDNIAAEKPQLSRLELTLLSMSVVAASCGPILFTEGYKIAEVLAPAAAACKYFIGFFA